MRHNDRRIRKSAVDCLTLLNDPANIKHWGPPSAIIQSYWKISSQTKLTIARLVVDNRQYEELTKTLLELLAKIMLSRNNFLASIKVVRYARVFVSLANP